MTDHKLLRYFKCLSNNTELRERQRLSIYWLLPKCLEHLGLGQAEAGSQEFSQAAPSAHPPVNTILKVTAVDFTDCPVALSSSCSPSPKPPV